MGVPVKSIFKAGYGGTSAPPPHQATYTPISEQWRKFPQSNQVWAVPVQAFSQCICYGEQKGYNDMNEFGCMSSKVKPCPLVLF